MTAAQLRAARALLRLSAEKLAEVAGVSMVTIRRAEAQDGPVRMMPANAEALRRSLEAAGVVFIPEDEDGAGVRLALSSGRNMHRSSDYARLALERAALCGSKREAAAAGRAFGLEVAADVRAWAEANIRPGEAREDHIRKPLASIEDARQGAAPMGQAFLSAMAEAFKADLTP